MTADFELVTGLLWAPSGYYCLYY